MDPQQRLLLEVVYEALENGTDTWSQTRKVLTGIQAGLTLEDVSGSKTAVYCGSFSNDYSSMLHKDLAQYPKYTVTGVGNSILANRVSYCFNLHGPSLTIDTACSSSLVCFHLGNTSLQQRESDIAIVAGSALHFDPNIFITMTDFGMLSVDGRCRTFDAAGSGYVRGEGICAVILKRKRDAVISRDHIRAVVRATHTNHDGLKDGLTLPNEKAQAELIRQTYKKAGLSTTDTDYFEAHGTGTAAGDPRETKAIGEVFGPERERPLLVGSVKSNVGHLEGASGLIGVIKAAMSVELGQIPPNMHFNTPNRKIDFEGLKIQVPTEVHQWRGGNGLRRASINSFGYGGSNAHVILENYTADQTDVILELNAPDIANGQDRPFLLPLTSHTERAGKLLSEKIAHYWEAQPSLHSADIAYSFSVRRSMHRYRSFAVGSSRGSVVTALLEPQPQAAWKEMIGNRPRVGFVFTGQGAQWYAMGRELIQKSSLFRQVLEQCDDILHELPDAPTWFIVDELLKSKEASLLGQSLYSQPLCAALQLAIVSLLKAWGISPSAVVGHSSGEIAAAYTAGVLPFESAIICAYYRGLYMSKGSGTSRGAMLAVGMTEREAAAELIEYTGRIAVAAVNSPSSLSLSGDEDAILALKERLTERKVFCRQLQVEQAFHSHHMVPLAPAFERALSKSPAFKCGPATCTFVSSVTARDSAARPLDSNYWADNMTGVVRFSDALTGIVLDEEDNQRVDILMEIGPHPALKGPSTQTLKALGLDIPYIGSLVRNVPAFESLLTAAGQLFALGYPVDLTAVNSNHVIEPGHIVSHMRTGKLIPDLPSYAWDHHSYWAGTRLIKEHLKRPYRHTILGTPVPGTPQSQPRWRGYLRQNEIPWLAHHVIEGNVVFPAAGYISMAIQAISTISPASLAKITLQDVVFQSALKIPSDDTGVEVMLDLEPYASSAKNYSRLWKRFKICSFDDQGRTIEHCHGLVSADEGPSEPLGVLKSSDAYEELQAKTNKTHPVARYYEKLQAQGLEYGEDFQLLSGAVGTSPGLAVASLKYSPCRVAPNPGDACVLHPSLLDASFHPIFAAIESRTSRSLEEAFVPTFLKRIVVSGLLRDRQLDGQDQRLWVKAETTLPGARVAITDLSMQSDLSRSTVVQIKGLELTALGRDSAENSKRALFFRMRWLPVFELLSTKDATMRLQSMADALDHYAHQFPNSNILHFTPSLETTREVFRKLGGMGGKGRRFQRLCVQSHNSDISSSPDAFEKQWPGLVDLGTPSEEGYDFVVVNQKVDVDLALYMKNGGFVLSDGKLTRTAGLSMAFETPDFQVWKKGEPQTIVMERNITFLVSDKQSVTSQSLANEIASRIGGQVHYVTVADLLHQAAPTTTVISLLSLDEDVFFDKSSDTSDTYRSIQRLLSSPDKNIVWLLHQATGNTANPAQAMIIGLARSVRSENEDSRLVVLDISSHGNLPRTAQNVIASLNEDFLEDELREAHGILEIPRLEIDNERNRKLSSGGSRETGLEPFRQSRSLSLKIGRIGLLDTLFFDDDEDLFDPELPPDEIEIEVKASAINFRDIAASMGIIDDYRLGDECSGVVLRVGKDVSDFNPGDRVIAWRPGQGAHRSIVRNPAVYCQKIGDMNFVIATAFPGVLMTAYYSLLDVARLQKGEYCLVHAAAGGVGQMALQLALMVGAKVIATVGSQEKRDFLKAQYGLTDDFIFSSRDTSFVDGVLTVTGGRGCDVALNSLAGELLHATWQCIAPFGRLVEIGKRDIHENTKLDMDPFRRNIAYASVDLITIFNLNRPLGARLLRDCYDLIRSGKVKVPSPLTEVPYADAQKGFRLLQMGKYFGKVVLVAGDKDMVPTAAPTYRNQPLFDPGKTYLLAGGLGGIGRSMSEWMVRRGARRLAFISRSGADKADARSTVRWLEARGVEVSVFRGDITDLENACACVQEIGDSLAGVFQAAMVLQDTPYRLMSQKQWATCVHPKTIGTYNLHIATARIKLDFFICFSSCSAVIGSKGQANYAAANCYMDALMQHRRERGLPGATMNVGMITGVGVVAEDDELRRIMDRIGYDPVNEDELFYQIEEALVAQWHRPMDNDGFEQHRTVTGINTKRTDLYWAGKPLFRNLYSNLDIGRDGESSERTMSLLSSLRNAGSAEERTVLFTTAFIDKIASVLSVPVDSVHASNALSMYGLDSIVAVEFRKWFSTAAGVEMALFEILGAGSIKELASKVVAGVQLSSSSDTTGAQLATLQQSFGAPGQKRAKFGAVKGLSLADELAALSPLSKVPMSTFQSRIWFLHNLFEDRSRLNFAVHLDLVGKPRMDALQLALNGLADRNAAFRTYYFDGDDFAEQATLDALATKVQFLDLSGEFEPETMLSAKIDEMRHQPLDIERGEAMRVSLIKRGEERFSVAFIFHHIMIDNGSTKSAMDQLTALYDAFAGGNDVSFVPQPKITYADFAVWHEQKLESLHTQEHVNWWRQQFQNAPPTCKLLPFAQNQRQDVMAASRLVLRQQLPLSRLNRLKRLAAHMEATPFQFLLAAFRAFIYRYTEEDDLTILMIDGNRPHPDLDDVIGFFVNMVPLRMRSDCDVAFNELVAQTKSTVLEALEHREVPFDTIVRAVNVKMARNHFPLGQIVVNYQMYGKPPKYKTTDFTVNDLSIEDIPTACEMSLEITEDPESGLLMRFEYDSFLYGQQDMDRFFDNFMTFLTSLIKDHRQPITESDMVGRLELEYLQSKFWAADLRTDVLQNESVASRIDRVASRYPESAAIITSDGRQITYSNLATNSRRIARHLSALGARNGNPVGIFGHPDVDFLAAMVASTYIGSGYVPLDPALASGRLAHIIDDSSVSAVLVSKDALPEWEKVSASVVTVPLVIPLDSLESEPVDTGTPAGPRPFDPFYVIYTSVCSCRTFLDVQILILAGKHRQTQRRSPDAFKRRSHD